ncbi:MAG: spondin domain-containing protein [Acidimicrobiia bacterium]|nr:spondin domain-containing protein [Acidimicrobiia bacterium]
MSKRSRWTALLAVVATAAFLIPAAASAGNTRTYEVTIYNMTGGQPFTPPLVATHKQPVDLFDVGEKASFGLKEIAENGNLLPLKGTLEANKHVSNVVVAVAGDPPPVMPGAAVTFTIDGGPGAKWLSYASMLICTNDGFTGADGLPLPKQVGDTVSAGSFAYDAGTETNTEMFSDIVPPCPPLTGVETMVEGSGTSNSALAEGGVITHHDGVVGGLGDEALVASVHDWSTSAPVAMISITRTN